MDRLEAISYLGSFVASTLWSVGLTMDFISYDCYFNGGLAHGSG